MELNYINYKSKRESILYIKKDTKYFVFLYALIRELST